MTDVTQADDAKPARKPRTTAAKPAAKTEKAPARTRAAKPAAEKAPAKAAKPAAEKAPAKSRSKAAAAEAPAAPARRSRARKADVSAANIKPAAADRELARMGNRLAQAQAAAEPALGVGRARVMEREAAPVIDLRAMTGSQVPAVVSSAQLPAVSEKTARLAATIDLADSTSIINFGASAQDDLQKVSQDMLQGVKNKDIGPASGAIATMVSTIRGFSVTQSDMSQKRSIGDWLMRRAAPIARFRAKFEQVQNQIETIAADLEGHRGQLDRDVASLDRLYASTLGFYEQLADYIAAGEAKLAEVDAIDIPEKEAQMEAAEEDRKPVVAQELRDLRAARDDLERRVHDLKLTRQVTMQSLPSIRLVQENDKALISKISSTLVNTVPLWESQMAQAITIQRSADAAGALKQATDLTNDLLKSNASNLRHANVAIRTEMERGVFDIQALQHANRELIGTLEDSLKIADAGKERRAAAEAELQKMESELRQSLTAARAQAETRALPR